MLQKSDYVEPGFVLLDLFFDVLLARRIVFHLRILDADSRVCRNGARDERVTADDGILSDSGLTAKDGCSGVNDDVVFDGRVTFLARKLLAASCRKSADSNALVDLNVLADDGCLTYYDARAVIDEEMLADRSTRMDVDTRS